MSNELYFIPLISKAVSQHTTRAEAIQILEKILELGQRPEYYHGFAQFQRFMTKVFEIQEDDIPWLTGIWEFQTVQRSIKVIITKDGKTIASLPMNLLENLRLIRNALPGLYTIRLSTGRVLWIGKLSEKDLLWSKAFPETELKLAAATGEVKRVSTKEFSVLDGGISIRVFPGFEDGTIEVMRSR